ncbi:hypothetical protein [Luteibacter sp. 22Crub2.1]|uniref:hypothetical protein n=1 Tax=Luteibacter sp. 22Crub2.1 TaxID=1283288 RepID=UPI0009A6C824|nr:hypothetical protein [Luteibacter sp. 22Crub2.1]SKB50883.1 hypothetical protein SAMN05660880_01383 [Luteibacter sp. 22Crub2.1]
MKRIAAVAAAAMVLSGCVSFSSIQKKLDGYKGRPLDDAIAHLGYPTAERTVAGHHLFVWGDSHAMALPSYKTSTTSGTVGGTPYSGTTGTWGTETIQAECVVTMEVNEAKVVTNVTFSGNHAGCDRYGS